MPLISRENGIGLLKRILRSVMGSKIGLKLVTLISEEREVYLASSAGARHRDLIARSIGLKVARGPFAGLEYASFSSVGSTLLPKLLGSYEAELHPIIETICSRSYRRIVDIGAAEGYYAIGFALNMPRTSVVAFEMSPQGRTLLRQMALTNNVVDRIDIRGTCTPTDLKQIGLCATDLIISDCEGAEYGLLDTQAVPQLADCDILIELHKAGHGDPREYWRTRLSSTHRLTFVDVASRNSTDYPELVAFPDSDRRALLFERTELSGWLWAETRSALAGNQRAPRAPILDRLSRIRWKLCRD